MRAVFMGTPEFAVPSLSALVEFCEVPLVVTMLDAIRGRGKTAVESPVARAARELGINVFKTARIDDAVLSAIRDVGADVCCVAAFGCLLPDELLAAFEFGCVNVHASLLPEWRGAAPIQRAILAGQTTLGVSIMRIVSDLDAGPWIQQATLDANGLMAPEATQRLAELGARELVAVLPSIADGTAIWTEQDASRVTYAAKVEKRELLLNPAASAEENYLRVAASLDTSPARASVEGRGVRVTNVSRVCDVCAGQGRVLIDGERVYFGCADAAFKVLDLRPDGKREMSAAEWARGQRATELSWSHV